MKEILKKIILGILEKIWTSFLGLSDLYKGLIVVSIGIILTILVLFIGVKIDEFLRYNFPKKTKKKKRKKS